MANDHARRYIGGGREPMPLDELPPRHPNRETSTFGGEAMPAVERRDIALDRDRKPSSMIETTGISVRRFRDVDEKLAEGEDGDMAGRAYLKRNGGWSTDMNVVRERFRPVEYLQPTD